MQGFHVPGFDLPGFDAQTIRAAVGAAAYARGVDYARRGAVVSLATASKPGQRPTLVGSVQGTAAYPYSVVVTSVPARGGSSAVAFGVCTCPLRNNCKHVAAVMVAAGAEPDLRRPRQAAWEDLLDITGERGDAEAGAAAVAVLIEPRRDRRGRWTLPMRPVRRGERGRWVRSGISWDDVTHGAGYRRLLLAPEAARLLQELYALHTSDTHGYYYGSGASTVDLCSFPSRRVWDLLADALPAGLPLVSTPDGTAVAVHPERAVAGLDLVDRDGAWSATPALTVDGAVVGADPAWVGDPAHGVAWLGEAGGGDGGRAHEGGDGTGVGAPARSGAAGVLHLARLARPLDAPARRLMAAPRPVTIPAADRARFVRDFLPVLRARLEVASGDGSVELPAQEPPRLVLTVTHDRHHRVGLAWCWRYRLGDEAIEVPLPESPGGPSPSGPTGAAIRPEARDLPAERQVVESVAAVLAPLAGPTSPPGAPHSVGPAEITGAEALRFEREMLPQLRRLDRVDVEIADGAGEFREAVGSPVVSLSGSAPTGTDWFDLTVTVTVDGQQVPFRDLFRALATRQEFLVLASGTYFSLDRPELQHLRDLIEESWALADGEDDTLRISRFQASYWEELAALGVLDEQAAEWSRSVRELARRGEIDPPDLPEGLAATLRPYQRDGYSWLTFLYDNNLGGVLADDMGLGKTVQALALICRAREDKPGGAPFLVVAPTSVVGNWAAEARRFAPGLTTVAITETQSRRGTPLDEVCAGADLVVTSYALFRLEFDRYELLGWSGLLIDEAQTIKNYRSQGYRCARKLRAPFKLAITGTPMENNLMELWAIFSIGAPGLLGDPDRFAEYYRVAIERTGDAERLEQLRRRIRPLLMRRTKQQVVADLPPKTEQVIELDLSPRHRRAYQQHLQRERRRVLGLLGDLDRNRFQVFRSLTLLRQAALDVSLVDDGSTIPSTKLDAMMEIVTGAAGEGHRALVFSQFTRFLDGARRRLDAAGIRYCYLDGATRRRAAVLAEFKDGDAPVFLISLKAGGVGLNLTEADYCILLDPWWNPATEAQAVDRAHRIGQDKPVMVYRLVARDTIEDKVMALQARKAALFSSVMTGGGVAAGGLTAGDIRGLLE